MTCVALIGGITAMGRNNSRASQKFMQMRVGAQAFTLAAVVFALAGSGRLFPSKQDSEANARAAQQQQEAKRPQ